MKSRGHKQTKVLFDDILKEIHALKEDILVEFFWDPLGFSQNWIEIIQKNLAYPLNFLLTFKLLPPPRFWAMGSCPDNNGKFL